MQNGGDYTDTYTLDPVGNELVKDHDAVGAANDETIIKTYDQRDRLLSEDSTNNANDATYTYDDNGSQITKACNDVTSAYKWDYNNLLVGVDTDGHGTYDIKYVYDTHGARVEETTTSGTMYYLNDTHNPTGYTTAVEERTDANADGNAETVARAYILGLQVVAQKAGSDIRILLQDGHGSTVLLVTLANVIDQHFDYDAFGKLLNMAVNVAKTNWLFGGEGPQAIKAWGFLLFQEVQP